MLRNALVLDEATLEPARALPTVRDEQSDPGQPFTLSPADLVFHGAGDRFTKNISALRLLKELEQSGRVASYDERRVLAHYSAFGEATLLNRLFRYDATRKRFIVAPDYADLLAEEEATALRRAALTAFYTPIDVVQSIWAAVPHLGLNALDRPRILEPAAGVGHFLSAMPAELRGHSDITAVELDPLTARILRQIHPDITLHAGVGFEAVDLPTDWFDLAISNVPFGDMPIHDPLIYEPLLRRTIHDYFFAKALRIVRPGGLIVFLTSWGTLDKQSTAVRAWLAEHADLLGAFRLPNGVFHSMSGSASATDLLILQKKIIPSASQPTWLQTAAADYERTTSPRSMTVGSRYTREIKDLDELLRESVHVNRHWLDEPACVIGQPTLIAADSSLWLQVLPPSDGIAPLLAERLNEHLPEGVILPWTPPAEPIVLRRQARDLHARADSLDLAAVSAKHQDRAAALAKVYHAAKHLIRLELADDPALDAARQAMGHAYDDCVACYGVISDPRNGRLFADVPELAFLLALETNPQQTHYGWRAEKARIFFERTLRPCRSATLGTLTPTEAVLRCLDEIGALDMHRVAALSGLPIPQAIEQLGDRIFREPGTAIYILADAYLSGNARAKLREARAWAERDAAYARNVVALEAVQPAPLGPSDIILNLNSYWLPDDIVTDFIRSLLPAFCGSAHYQSALAEWVLNDLADAGASSVEASSRWGTVRANAITILRACLRGMPISVYDEIRVGDTTRRVLNPAETVAAQEKQEAIRAAFTRWAWGDVQRAERLCALYNEQFNSVRIRSYDGQHLTFPGMATSILRDNDLADYQKGAVWQILQNPTALLAHAVGAGKTFSAIAAMVEAKRMGLTNKALAVVPNTLVGQWASEARRLYPGIHVLAMAPEDFEKHRRGTVLSRIATGDWDIVVVAHTSFKFLPVGTQILDRFRAKETDRLRSFLEELRANATAHEDKRSLKQIEKAILKFEARLESIAVSIKRDSARTITWEELGIDMLVVDESHEFKNLFTPTKLTNIAGLPTASSQRALDMRIKTWDVQRRGGKVVFLTATPIMNTMGEAYVMQLYLQERELETAGIHHFDEWVSLYAQPRMAFEMKPDGSGFRMNTRLNTFVNLPELAAMWRQVLNVKTKERLKLPEPTLVTGKIIPVVVPASVQLKRYIQSLAARVEDIRRGKVDPSEDNMLRVTGDGRKAALDIRLVLPGAEQPRQSKILALVERVKQLYDTFEALKGTQLIFCDLSTPRGRGPQTPSATAAPGVEEGEKTEARTVETAEEVRQSNFVYYEIREELARRGVPAEEIAFIHEYQTKAARDALFAAMNEGRVRVLIGSTQKMGTGMNVQRRLIALHNLDCPWRPGDLEQRHGRILRQGNLWPSVYIFTYVTEGSFDGYMFQTIENKARFISQALAGEITARTVEDTAELVLSAAEVKAIASGNPLIVRKVQLETELARMERVRAVHLDTILALRMDRRRTEAAIAELDVRRQILEQAQCIVDTQHTDSFTATIVSSLGSERTRWYDKRAEAGSALATIVEQFKTAALLERTSLARQVGTYRGLTLQVQTHPLFGLAIHLCLPDGTPIDELNAQSGAGLFASADSLIRALPERKGNVADTISAKQQRIVEIDAELERLAVWDGQAAYEAAVKALASINTTLTVLEAQETAPALAPSTNSTSLSADDGVATPDDVVSEETIAAVEALWSEVDEEEPHVSIPPAVEALAFMEQELRHQVPAHRTEVAAETAIAEMKAEREADAPSITPSSPHYRPPASRRLVFGQPLPAPQRRSARAQEHRIGHQLDVFSPLEAHRHAPASPATERTQDHTLADPAAMEQRSLFD